MSPDKDKALCQKYPGIFRDRRADMRQTAMCWGFDCGDGWYGLIDDLCMKLLLISEACATPIVADQVKEKFGELRFYFHIEAGGDDWFGIAEDVVDMATARSRHVCEACGARGRLNDGPWYSVRCEKCREAGE